MVLDENGLRCGLEEDRAGGGDGQGKDEDLADGEEVVYTPVGSPAPGLSPATDSPPLLHSLGLGSVEGPAVNCSGPSGVSGLFSSASPLKAAAAVTSVSVVSQVESRSPVPNIDDTVSPESAPETTRLDTGRLSPPPPIETETSSGLAPATTADDRNCVVCEEIFPSVDLCEIHFHQFHKNPNQLKPEAAKKFRISNFVVNTHEDRAEEAAVEGENSPTYRCHECFNVFSLLDNLKQHLVSHNMAPKTEYLPNADFAPAFKKKTPGHRKRRPVLSNNRKKDAYAEAVVPAEAATPPVQNGGGGSDDGRSRPRRVAALRRLVEIEPEISDEFNSNSENEADLSNRGNWRRPQRECKTRTKTLVAISLAEQEYEKFDLGTCLAWVPAFWERRRVWVFLWQAYGLWQFIAK